MTTVTAESTSWSSTQKVAFRFFMCFFLLYIFFNPNGVIPNTENIFSFYITPFHTLVPCLAKHVLHMAKPITIFTNGSGDTTYDYVTLLFLTVLSAIGAAIWSVTGRNTKHYNKLFYWLCVVLRYYVAISMISYGSFKVIKLQFPAPSLDRLIEPLGRMSPMGLAWTYVGYSTGFNYFTGIAELACGLLLLFRKTTNLGAILTLVVMGNVMAINYCFDVPVKLLSTAMVGMCLFLLLRDNKRFINFFFKNRDAGPSNLSPHRFNKRWKNIVLTTIKYALIVYVITFDLKDVLEYNSQFGPNTKKPPLYGLYVVQSFVRNKDTVPPLTTDTTRWNKLIVSKFPGYGQLYVMDDSTKIKHLALKPDTIKHTIVLNTQADTLHKYTFTYTVQKPDILILNGKWKQDSLHIRFKRFDESHFLLMNRGFHWVNEFPLNR